MGVKCDGDDGDVITRGEQGNNGRAKVLQHVGPMFTSLPRSQDPLNFMVVLESLQLSEVSLGLDLRAFEGLFNAWLLLYPFRSKFRAVFFPFPFFQYPNSCVVLGNEVCDDHNILLQPLN